ncbi:MAG: hypothetical protein ACYDH4_10115 [Candidatus Cryosericum sp.]
MKAKELAAKISAVAAKYPDCEVNFRLMFTDEEAPDEDEVMEFTAEEVSLCVDGLEVDGEGKGPPVCFLTLTIPTDGDNEDDG